MRALAEFVMKGRAQAILVAVLASTTVLFTWVGAAVVALVILRQGFKEGFNVLLWALLPSIVMVVLGDTGPLATMLGTALLASVLRVTASWPLTLIAAAASGVLTGLALLAFGQAYIEEILRFVGEFITQLQNQATQGQQVNISAPTVVQILGLLGLGNAITVTLCLILARWWQALLYNPGGFRQEFHSLRLTPPLTVLLLVAGIALSSLGADYRFWALICVVPFMFAGFALVHGWVAKKQMNGHWLGLFYIGWFILDPIKLLLLLVVVVDSWFDLRGRLDKA
ncbi:hypothetical protein NO559_02110 [Dasania sp. GY-MA-18]|uniref:DUF2232 domain-containing protein n=1 Tax=Dasania phycosphaerae TaxID=2950436 RepID=A0A9J6RH34_9GAMM|nr:MULTISPECIES: hypothetical protein [Dasania]MCR8921546.1 hypothetical protein [Dasania sp. GY-MA-18]MCZ0863974.1 hypothetical protein [Dasania phycosphaerae]MCZ0867702.1 hypothetical protein [Dasania phycosphaerae]